MESGSSATDTTKIFTASYMLISSNSAGLNTSSSYSDNAYVIKNGVCYFSLRIATQASIVRGSSFDLVKLPKPKYGPVAATISFINTIKHDGPSYAHVYVDGTLKATFKHAANTTATVAFSGSYIVA
jgi:hypothetical protein